MKLYDIYSRTVIGSFPYDPQKWSRKAKKSEEKEGEKGKMEKNSRIRANLF